MEESTLECSSPIINIVVFIIVVFIVAVFKLIAVVVFLVFVFIYAVHALVSAIEEVLGDISWVTINTLCFVEIRQLDMVHFSVTALLAPQRRTLDSII